MQPLTDIQRLPAAAGLPSEFARYLAASAVALSVDVGVLAGLTELFGIDYLLAAGIGFTCGMLTIYLLSTRWVFARRRLQDRGIELGLFITIGIVGLLINQAGMWLLTEGLQFFYLLSKAGVTGLVFLWNFTARKWLLFR